MRKINFYRPIIIERKRQKRKRIAILLGSSLYLLLNAFFYSWGQSQIQKTQKELELFKIQKETLGKEISELKIPAEKNQAQKIALLENIKNTESEIEFYASWANVNQESQMSLSTLPLSDFEKVFSSSGGWIKEVQIKKDVFFISGFAIDSKTANELVAQLGSVKNLKDLKPSSVLIKPESNATENKVYWLFEIEAKK